MPLFLHGQLLLKQCSPTNTAQKAQLSVTEIILKVVECQVNT